MVTCGAMGSMNGAVGAAIGAMGAAIGAVNGAAVVAVNGAIIGDATGGGAAAHCWVIRTRMDRSQHLRRC